MQPTAPSAPKADLTHGAVWGSSVALPRERSEAGTNGATRRHNDERCLMRLMGLMNIVLPKDMSHMNTPGQTPLPWKQTSFKSVASKNGELFSNFGRCPLCRSRGSGLQNTRKTRQDGHAGFAATLCVKLFLVGAFVRQDFGSGRIPGKLGFSTLWLQVVERPSGQTYGQ